jgi:hypothetical protein
MKGVSMKRLFCALLVAVMIALAAPKPAQAQGWYPVQYWWSVHVTWFYVFEDNYTMESPSNPCDRYMGFGVTSCDAELVAECNYGWDEFGNIIGGCN